MWELQDPWVPACQRPAAAANSRDLGSVDVKQKGPSTSFPSGQS